MLRSIHVVWVLIDVGKTNSGGNHYKLQLHQAHLGRVLMPIIPTRASNV